MLSESFRAFLIALCSALIAVSLVRRLFIWSTKVTWEITFSTVRFGFNGLWYPEKLIIYELQLIFLQLRTNIILTLTDIFAVMDKQYIDFDRILCKVEKTKYWLWLTLMQGWTNDILTLTDTFARMNNQYIDFDRNLCKNEQTKYWLWQIFTPFKRAKLNWNFF